MKRLKLVATIGDEGIGRGERIGFAIEKTKDMDRIEILGILDFVKSQIIEGMGEKIKIEKVEGV